MLLIESSMPRRNLFRVLITQFVDKMKGPHFEPK